MFNTYHTTEILKHPDVHHHEHRAPTDQSIAILKDMEEKTIKGLLDRVTVSDCGLNVHWMVRKDYAAMRTVAHLKMKVGEISHEMEINLEEFGSYSRQDSLDKIGHTIFKKISEQITLELFRNHGEDLMRSLK